MANEKILVVDDDANICELLRLYLTKEGYQVTVANDGEEGLEKFNAVKPDMVLLDVMMPRMDGLEVCRRIRKAGNTPVMMLTAKGETFDKVLGLELGADDYMVKPFDFRELIAVIHVMARKSGDNHSNIYKLADLTLDIAAKQVTRGGKVIDLTAKEYALLEFMMRNKGMVLSREQIENNLWNYDYEGGTNVVDVYVGYLRKKIDTGFSKKLIHTVWGTGWVLRED